MLIGKTVDGPMHGQSLIEPLAGALPASALQQVGKQIAELILDVVIGQEDVRQPVHAVIITRMSPSRLASCRNF